jgi:apolipoprotein N-acyltransferase
MAALALLVERAARLGARSRHGFALGLAFGAGANMVAFRFVPEVILRFTSIPAPVAWLALTALAVEQGARWGAAAGLHLFLVKRGVPSALAFAGAVFAGTFVPAVFPWSPAGGVTPVPEMVQLAELGGERGVTFVMALAAGLAGSAVSALRLAGGAGQRRAGVRLGLALMLPAVTYGGGRLRMRQVQEDRGRAPTTSIALVQPETDATDRWDRKKAAGIVQRLTDATARGEREGAELTIWPEAAYPYLVAHTTRLCPVGADAMLPLGVRGPVLTGMVMTGGDGDVWNSAAICHTNGRLDPPQDKVHLLWFGETIPYLDQIPWVRGLFTRGIGLVAGKGVVLQRTERVRAGVLNCFEDTLPAAGRDAMAAGPNLLVNVTNDAWFSSSAESELHLRLSVLRAVESRRDLVRAVNEGQTSWVDASGVVRARGNARALDVVMATPALLETPPTPYDRFGDLPLGLTLAAAAIASLRRAADKMREA